MTRYEEDGMVRTDEKRISCKRCQRRKIKCSRTAPCRRCLTAGVQCEYRESDCKRAPISREYVTALECRIASLERALEMKGAVHCNHDCNVVTSAQEGRLDMSLAGSDLDGNVTQSSSNEKDTIKCHGSSDVYDTCILRAMEPERSLHIPSLETVQMDREMLPRGSFIEECLNLYFRWLHASFAIIDQAQFFAEFGSGTYSTEMCSPALVYAMSALGALVSDEPAIRTMADDYACEARRRMIPSGYPPSMSMIQAALLCAMYETGQGDQSNLWFYMGIISGAMEDREHQRSRPDARLDEGKKSGTSSPVNPHDSWTRMHMNCYLSDKVLGLLLGRRASLSELKTQLMDEHIHPADPVDIYLHTPKSNSDDLTSIAMSPAPFSVIEKQYELARIIDDLMASTRCKRAEHPSWQSVERLNVRLCAWHESLPTQLRWNRWTSSLDDIDLGVAGLHMLYHTTRISLNRSFLRSKKASAWVEASQNLCSASVELVVSILQRYRAQHSLRRAPLIFVHGTIIAADVLLRTSPSGLPVLDRGCLSVLEDALAQLAYSWDLARLAHEGMAKLSRQTPATTASYGGIVSSTRSRHAAPDLTAAEDGLEADSGFLNFDTGLFDVSVDMMVAAAESASSIFWAGVSDADMVEDRTMGFG